MRITDTGSVKGPADIKKKRKAGSVSSSAFSDAMESTSDVADSSSAAPIANIGGVLSVDSLGILTGLSGEEQAKRDNIEWGKDVLKTLEGIKYQILNGKISYGSLMELKQRLNNIPLNTTDFRLKQIVEEIEVRAAVELEKYKKLAEETKMFLE